MRVNRNDNNDNSDYTGFETSGLDINNLSLAQDSSPSATQIPNFSRFEDHIAKPDVITDLSAFSTPIIGGTHLSFTHRPRFPGADIAAPFPVGDGAQSVLATYGGPGDDENYRIPDWMFQHLGAASLPSSAQANAAVEYLAQQYSCNNTDALQAAFEEWFPLVPSVLQPVEWSPHTPPNWAAYAPPPHIPQYVSTVPTHQYLPTAHQTVPNLPQTLLRHLPQPLRPISNRDDAATCAPTAPKTSSAKLTSRATSGRSTRAHPWKSCSSVL